MSNELEIFKVNLNFQTSLQINGVIYKVWKIR